MTYISEQWLEHMSGHNKKARDFTHFLIHKSTLLSSCVSRGGLGQRCAASRTETCAFHALPDSEIYTPQYYTKTGEILRSALLGIGSDGGLQSAVDRSGSYLPSFSLTFPSPPVPRECHVFSRERDEI